MASFAVEPTFPLKVSESRRHLVDQAGTPFLYHADTPWMLFTKLTEAEAKDYIARRKEQGFTALQVQLTGFFGMTNVAGARPFANVLWILGGDNDPNNARAEIRALGLGLKDAAPQQLITYHAASAGSITDKKRHDFEPPADGDWALTLDDADKKSSDPRNPFINP